MRSAANPPHAAAAVARCLPVRLSVCLRLKFKVRKHISQDVLCYGLGVKGQRYTMPQKNLPPTAPSLLLYNRARTEFHKRCGCPHHVFM